MSRKNEMNHVVYSGWMIKSPPEKKLTGPWRIFRAKWKKRYFVLSKPAQSLPGIYNLQYYSDENCKRPRGAIDLEQCAEIIESLDSDQFQYLLAIKTTHKGRERTYFLATDTEEQMSTWVRNLCSVCGMKPDESVEEQPQAPTREESVKRPQVAQPQASLASAATGIMTKPSNPIITKATSSTRGSPSTRARPLPQQRSNPKPQPCVQRESEYIPLETCHSGTSIKQKHTARQESVDSVPEEFAPPPPMKMGPQDIDDVFGNVNNTYDIPPSAEAEDLYKVPPPRPSQTKEVKEKNMLETYDFPPQNPSPVTPRSSSSDSQKYDSAYSSNSQMYDTPPLRQDVLTEDDIYDIPPTHVGNMSMTLNTKVSLEEKPPLRPPKPGHLLSATVPVQEPYMNLPTGSKIFNNRDINSVVLPTSITGMVQTVDLYDIPKAGGTALDNNLNNVKHSETKDRLLSATPPPPSMCIGPIEHKYINAYHGIVEPQQEYIAMDPALAGSDSKQRKSSSTSNEVEYTDMSGKTSSSFDESFDVNSIYDHPPPSRPSAPPPRPVKSVGAVEKQDTYSIFSNARTRSFKKKSEGSPLLAKKKKSPLASNASIVSQTSVQLPQRTDKHPDFSTSDEDDDDMCSSDVWETIPPVPANKDTELKYVDLDHEKTLDKEPMRSPHAASSNLTPTEYHEIDFVKTVALRNVKETVCVERNKEKNNT